MSEFTSEEERKKGFDMTEIMIENDRQQKFWANSPVTESKFIELRAYMLQVAQKNYWVDYRALEEVIKRYVRNKKTGITIENAPRITNITVAKTMNRILRYIGVNLEFRNDNPANSYNVELIMVISEALRGVTKIIDEKTKYDIKGSMLTTKELKSTYKKGQAALAVELLHDAAMKK